MTQHEVAKPAAPTIGDYRIISKIGQGGIAEVYKALQTSLQREVAVKVLSPRYTLDSEIVKRFEQESLMIARLNHPNIVHVIDRGVKGGRCYFVMEFIDGVDFKKIVSDPGVDIKVKIDVVIQVCKALDYAHKNGIIHRDVKPANILVDRNGNAKVVDFGIAQLRDDTDGERTSADVVMGTLAYMSPEQKQSSANVTYAADIFALGVIIYEIACGRKPEGRFKLPSEINPGLPRTLDDIIVRCLAEHPCDRYPSAGALKDTLLNAFSGEIYSSTPADSAIAKVESFMGRCRFLDTIKETRFGATFLVENEQARKLYVIKKLAQTDAGLKEARILSALRHKNIIAVLGAGGDIKKSAIVTEYASGGSLAERMARIYSWRDALAIGLQIAEGLEFAHRNNVVHGDLRPSNVLFDEHETVKLTDFGLPPHYSMHKDWFAPPEKRSSRQGDIFSLGVILFMLMTGKFFEHDPSGSPSLNELNLKVPGPIRDILSKMLQIRVAKRYQSIQEILDDYKEYLASLEPLAAEESPAASHSRPKTTILPFVFIFAAIALGVLLALFWDKLF